MRGGRRRVCRWDKACTLSLSAGKRGFGHLLDAINFPLMTPPFSLLSRLPSGSHKSSTGRLAKTQYLLLQISCFVDGRATRTLINRQRNLCVRRNFQIIACFMDQKGAIKMLQTIVFYACEQRFLSCAVCRCPNTCACAHVTLLPLA